MQGIKRSYEAFGRQDLGGREQVYIWAQAIYLKACLGMVRLQSRPVRRRPMTSDRDLGLAGARNAEYNLT